MAYIHPQTWPESSPKPRVLVENPDGAELWAHAEILRDAGYEVATCAGPADAAILARAADRSAPSSARAAARSPRTRT